MASSYLRSDSSRLYPDNMGPGHSLGNHSELISIFYSAPRIETAFSLGIAECMDVEEDTWSETQKISYCTLDCEGMRCL
jgi:hypothetical protein